MIRYAYGFAQHPIQSDPQRHNYRDRAYREGMPIRKVINRLLLRSQRRIDLTRGVDKRIRRLIEHVLFFFFFSPSNRVFSISCFFFFFAIAGQRPKKVNRKWRIDGTTRGLINSVTALQNGRVSFRPAICHVPKGTYKQNEAVSVRFINTILVFVEYEFIFISREVCNYWYFFFFLRNFVKDFTRKTCTCILESNCEQRL